VEISYEITNNIDKNVKGKYKDFKDEFEEQKHLGLS